MTRIVISHNLKTKYQFIFLLFLIVCFLYSCHSSSNDTSNNKKVSHYTDSVIGFADTLEKVTETNKQKNGITAFNKEDKLSVICLAAALLLFVLLLIMQSYKFRKSKEVNRQILHQNNLLQSKTLLLENSREENMRMIKIVAHDLRNPVSAILSIVSFMSTDDYHNEEDKMMFQIMKTAGENSLLLIGDLLDVNTNKENLKKEVLDLSVIIHHCIELLMFKAVAKEQHIEEKTTPVTIHGNHQKLWRVIINLLSNAIKFSSNGTRILVKLEAKSQHALITIKDSGIGIPLAIQDKIFDIFTDAKRSGTAGEVSYGLGLAVSKQIVEAHGGRIWFESEAGEGATFFVELPYK